MNIVVVDIGIGNIRSVANALSYLKADYCLTDKPKIIEKSKYLILPGVGSFDGVMNALEKKKLIMSIKAHINEKKKPFLGICVGMQILMKKSEEGKKEGLNIFSEKLEKLEFRPSNKENKVPNVGFSAIFGYRQEGLFKDFKDTENFYFTHSYALKKVRKIEGINLAYCEHNSKFISALNYKNVSAVQFHPEKSQSIGLKLISNFLEAYI